MLSVVELPDVAEEFAQGRADLAALDGKLTEASTEIAAATERIQVAEDILSPLPGDLEAVRAEADAAVVAAEQARNEALAAQTAATEANARATTVLPNGSFEDDLKYWQALPGKTLPTITTDAYVESKAARFGDNTGIKSTVNIPVTPAQVWELSAYYKSTTASSGGIVLEFSDAQDVLAPKSTVQPTPDVSGKWVRAVLRVIIPDGMDYLTAKIDYVKGGVTIDEFTLRDVTDVVRLEKSAQEAATKAQSAIDKSSALEAKVATLEVGHKAVTERLTKAESDLSANREKATADLTALNATLREAFATADSNVLASAETLASQAKSDAVAVAKEDAQTKVNEALEAANATALQIAKAEAQREAEEAQKAAEAYAQAQASGASSQALADAKAYAEKQAREAEQAAKAVAESKAPLVSGTAQNKTFRDVLNSYSHRGTGIMVIETNVTLGDSSMVRIPISISEWTQQELEGVIFFYSSAASGGTINNPRVMSIGAQEFTTRLGVNSSNKVVFTIEKNGGQASWSYPRVNIPEIYVSYVIPEGVEKGWSVKYVPDLSEYTKIIDARPFSIQSDAQARADAAQSAATTHADGLPKVLHGITAPSTSAPEGSVYFMHQTSITGRVVGQWVRSAGTWTSTPITDAAIANLDVGKLTAGTAAIDVAVLNKVWADLGVFNRLTAGEAWIGGAQIKDGEITAPKITVTDSLVTNILGAQAVVADQLVANGNLWAKAAQIITLDASRLTVTDSASISEAVIEKFWAQTAVIQRLTAGEAWIGETVIKDGAITAPKIRADSVEASHIKAKAIKADHMDFVSVDPSTGGAMSLDSSGIRLEREGSTIFQLTNASVDTISLIGADGANVAGMSNDGSVTGQIGTFEELNVGGMSLNTIMEEQPRGIVARAVRDNSTNARPSTSSDHIQPVMRMEFPVRGGYTYEIRAEGLGVYMDKYTGTTAAFYMYSAGDNNIAAIGDSGTRVRATAITPIRSEHSGDTAPVSMVWHFTPSSDYVASILIGYSIWRGSEPVRINCGTNRLFTLTAREFERVVSTGKTDFLGTVGAGNTSTENVAAPRRETQTWAASAAASWAGGSRYSTDYAGSTNDLWQGYWSGSPNARMSHINFNGLGDKGKSIASTRGKITTLEKLEVYLYNSFFYYYSGGKVRLHFHNSTTTGSYPSTTTYIGDVSMGRGAGKWIEITNSSAKAAFLSGGFTGIALDPRGSKDQNYYGAFKGMDGGKYIPKIRATYLTT